MKRVLILNYELPPLGGGGGVAALTIAKGLLRKGYEVDYITTRHKTLPSFEVLDGINVYRVKVLGRKGIQTATPISLFSFPFAAIWQTFKLCRIYKYAFMHTHFVVPTGPLGFIFSKLFKIKNYVFIHGGDIYDPTRANSCHRSNLFRKVISFLLNRADAVVTQSQDMRDHCVRFYKPKTPIQIVPLPYIPRAFKSVDRAELGLRDDKKYVIGVGRLIKRKDFVTFILALSRLDDSFEGIILGYGPEYKHLLQTAKAVGVEERLHFIGQVSEEKKFQYLLNSDIFLLTSIHEGFGIVVQEAMQVGLPIIATDCGGQRDLVEENINGFLVKVGNVDGIVVKIRNLLTDQNICKQISARNILKIKDFDLDIICNRYLNLHTAVNTSEAPQTTTSVSPSREFARISSHNKGNKGD